MPTGTFPSLPAELWNQILIHVSYIPGALTTSDLTSIAAFTRDDHAVNLHSRYAEALATKLALCCVCRALNDLTRPFLYQYVVIRSARHAVSVATALATSHPSGRSYSGSAERSTSRSGSNYYYHSKVNGAYVRRLEIATVSQHIWDPPSHAVLLSILHLCPNLTTFSDAFCSGPSNVLSCKPIINRLSYLCISRSLRRFEWSSGTNVWLVRTLRSLPYLRVFFLASGAIRVGTDGDTNMGDFEIHRAHGPGSGPGFPGPVYLPSLRLLAIGKHATEVPDRTQLRVPKLSHFVTYRPIPVVHPRYLEPGMYPIVSTLRTLHVPVDNLSGVHRLLRECDFLERLTLEFGFKAASVNSTGASGTMSWGTETMGAGRKVFDRFVVQPHLERVDISGIDFNLSTSTSEEEEHRKIMIAHIRCLLHHFLTESLFPSLRSIGLLFPLITNAQTQAHERVRSGSFSSSPFSFSNDAKIGKSRRDLNWTIPNDVMHLWDEWLAACAERKVDVYASVGSEDHTAGIWRPFDEVVRRKVS